MADSMVAGRTVFLSGPMTGYEHYNARGFVEAQIRMKLLGAERVYNPISQWLGEPERISGTRDHESYMLECLHELTRRDGRGGAAYDMVVQLDGWEASEGAQMEAEVARACGIPLVPIAEAGPAPAPGEGEEAPADPQAARLWDEWGNDIPVLWWNPIGTGKSFALGEWGNDIPIIWWCRGKDGSLRIGAEAADLRPIEVATLLAIQDVLSDAGIDKSGIRRMRIVETPTTGMSAFANDIVCIYDGDRDAYGRFSFQLVGPALPDKGIPLCEQVEVEGLDWAYRCP